VHAVARPFEHHVERELLLIGPSSWWNATLSANDPAPMRSANAVRSRERVQ
jgi:hypothetical protein